MAFVGGQVCFHSVTEGVPRDQAPMPHSISAMLGEMERVNHATWATVSWEGDSRDVLRAWPKGIREDFGISLADMQQGHAATLRVRPMPSIGAGVFELKDQDAGHWYRMVYLARIRDTIYVLHCFTKDSAKTEKRDIATAERRFKQVQQRLRDETRDEKQTP